MSVPKIWAYNERVTSVDLNGNFNYVNSLVPVGTILAFYDFNATVTFDADIFKYCNGQTISDALSPLNTLTLPDLSNRYIVGFGTEAGGDIGTATWSSTIVGNASHQINIQHYHDMQHKHTYAHTHNLKNHTHTGSGTSDFLYTGGVGTSSPNCGTIWSSSNIGESSRHFQTSPGADGAGNHKHNYSFTTSTPSDNTSDAVSTSYGSNSLNFSSGAGKNNTENSLSTTQSIQPRSVQVRWIIRYK